MSEMCRFHGVDISTFTRRRKKGRSLEQALKAASSRGPGRPCTDHLGNEYPSESAMFKAYGINYTVFHYRYDIRHWSLEKALTTPPGDTDMAGAHACVDHLGNKFPSKKAMCEYWHIPRNVFFVRKKEGKSLAECLAPVPKLRQNAAYAVTDHTGQTHQNLDAMCKAWGMPKSQYIQNIRNGLDKGRALTERTKRPEHPKDHTGHEFPSINAMCHAWGITKTVLRSRLELGWTLEEVLTHPENNSHLIRCKDHLGREYPSQKAMLKAWNVTHSTYKHRLKHGRTLQEALDPGSLHALKSTDHEGRTFPSLLSMLEYWCVAAPTYHHRVQKLGMPQEQAITYIRSGQSLPGGITVGNAVNDRYYLVSDGRATYVLDQPKILRMCRRGSLRACIDNDELPDGFRARYMGAHWFQVWGTDLTGPSPGMLLDSDRAWLELCRWKYRVKPKKTIR